MAARLSTAPRHGDAGPLRRPLVRAFREYWGRERMRQSLWRVVFLTVLAILLLASVLDHPYRAPITAWVIAGSVAWIASVAAERERACQVRRHDTCGLPAVGGWRLVATPADLPPDALMALDLIIWLYDHARLERRPIRGHSRGGTRVTYAGGGLRAEARRWAADRGAPVRLGDRTLARLRAAGVVHGVRISQVVAHRMTYPTAEDAIRAYERASGSCLVVSELGRDPRAGAGGSAVTSHADEAARA